MWIYPNNRLYTGRLIVLSLPAGFAMIFATIIFAAGRGTSEGIGWLAIPVVLLTVGFPVPTVAYIALIVQIAYAV